MRKPIVALLLWVLLLFSVSSALADVYRAKPKLVVILVIDQFRGDYLNRYRDALKTSNGFNLFLKRGAYFNSCYFDYANTKTAPGHATIGTGAYTDGHGIGSNEWWDLSRNTDRVISSVEDERYRLVGDFDDLPVLAPPPAPAPNDPRIGSSPINLLATTIGDEVRLATQGQAELYGVSLKDRAAILPAGQTANGAFWIDNSSGRFVTSTYYMQKLPDWATKFNEGPRIGQAVKEAGLENTGQFYALVGHTPAANSYELDFVRALIEGESMGQHAVTDVLTISLSANDIEGHQFGPDSDVQLEMVVRLDQDLDSFFSYLDKKIGLENVMIALTADHGVAPIPAESAKLGVASARLDLDAFTMAIDESLNARFSSGKSIHYFMPTQELPYLTLDPRAFGSISEKEAEQAVIDAIPAAVKKLGAPVSPPNTLLRPEATRKYQESRVEADPSIYFSRSRVDLASGKVPNTEFGRLIAHSYSDHGGWYVMVFPTAYQMEYATGIQTTHFSPWSYDRYVPLGFFGEEFLPGLYRELVAPVDIAATFASILGVNAPSASVGRVLTEALRTAEQARLH
jgi:Type I phosphodiesterase / nucleotide pyrophosphatase